MHRTPRLWSAGVARREWCVFSEGSTAATGVSEARVHVIIVARSHERTFPRSLHCDSNRADAPQRSVPDRCGASSLFEIIFKMKIHPALTLHYL